MAPRASCLIDSPTAIVRLFVTEKYVVVASFPGRIVSLSAHYQHKNLDLSNEDDPHRRVIEAGELWDAACHDSLIATANKDGVGRLWGLDSGELLREFHGHTATLTHILIPDVSTVITTSPDTTIRVWDISSGACRYVLEGHARTVLTLATHNNLLFSGDNDGAVKMWDLTTGQHIRDFEGGLSAINLFGFNDDKTLLAGAFGKGDIRIWRIADGVRLAVCKGHTLIATQFSNRNGNLVSSAADASIRTWNWQDGALLHTIDNVHEGPNGAIRGVVWTRDFMISGGMDGVVRVRKTEDNQPFSEYRSGATCIWHLTAGHGKLAVASSSSRIKEGTQMLEVWNLEDLEDGHL